MGENRFHRRSFRVAALAILAALVAAVPARADGAGASAAPLEAPGFRTDLGVHASFGGSSAVGGGNNYAASSAWDTLFGFQVGAILRPFRHFSFGVDLGYTLLRMRQQTANSWSDLTIGPALRFHLPLRLGRKLLLEPSLGLEGGYVYGVYHEDKQANGDGRGTVLNHEHTHTGPFVALLGGLDLFPVPRVGFGVDLRVLRTFYTTVCFDDGQQTICRGTTQGELATNDINNTVFSGDKREATYPWKMFWGVHALYYF
jgi:hypothetical protein